MSPDATRPRVLGALDAAARRREVLALRDRYVQELPRLQRQVDFCAWRLARAESTDQRRWRRAELAAARTDLGAAETATEELRALAAELNETAAWDVDSRPWARTRED